MNNPSLSEIKKELQLIPKNELVELCTKLAKYKKENKELLGYILFDSINEDAFIINVQEEITRLFEEIKFINSYFAKKSIRKILRITNKYIKYSGKPSTALELLLHYCMCLKRTRINFNESIAIMNLYLNQIKKIEKLLDKMHEDYRTDFIEKINELKVF